MGGRGRRARGPGVGRSKEGAARPIEAVRALGPVGEGAARPMESGARSRGRGGAELGAGGEGALRCAP